MISALFVILVLSLSVRLSWPYSNSDDTIGLFDAIIHYFFISRACFLTAAVYSAGFSWTGFRLYASEPPAGMLRYFHVSPRNDFAR